MQPHRSIAASLSCLCMRVLCCFRLECLQQLLQWFLQEASVPHPACTQVGPRVRWGGRPQGGVWPRHTGVLRGKGGGVFPAWLSTWRGPLRAMGELVKVWLLQHPHTPGPFVKQCHVVVDAAVQQPTCSNSNQHQQCHGTTTSRPGTMCSACCVVLCCAVLCCAVQLLMWATSVSPS